MVGLSSGGDGVDSSVSRAAGACIQGCSHRRRGRRRAGAAAGLPPFRARLSAAGGTSRGLTRRVARLRGHRGPGHTGVTGSARGLSFGIEESSVTPHSRRRRATRVCHRSSRPARPLYQLRVDSRPDGPRARRDMEGAFDRAGRGRGRGGRDGFGMALGRRGVTSACCSRSCASRTVERVARRASPASQLVTHTEQPVPTGSSPGGRFASRWARLEARRFGLGDSLRRTGRALSARSFEDPRRPDGRSRLDAHARVPRYAPARARGSTSSTSAAPLREARERAPGARPGQSSMLRPRVRGRGRLRATSDRAVLG